MKKQCHACGLEWKEYRQPGRMEKCIECNAWMRCCNNCKNYVAGTTRGCGLFNIDTPKDKERYTDCDEFMLSSNWQGASKSSESKEDPKKKLDSLFKD